MYLNNADEYYNNDPVFRSLIDVLMSLILKLEMTPSEIRQAAIYASIKVERIKPLDLKILREEDEAMLKKE